MCPQFPSAATDGLALLPRGSASSSAIGSAAAVAWHLAVPHRGGGGLSGPVAASMTCAVAPLAARPWQARGGGRRVSAWVHLLVVSSATASGDGGQAAGGHAPTGPPASQRQHRAAGGWSAHGPPSGCRAASCAEARRARQLVVSYCSSPPPGPHASTHLGFPQACPGVGGGVVARGILLWFLHD